MKREREAEEKESMAGTCSMGKLRRSKEVWLVLWENGERVKKRGKEWKRL